MNHPVFNLPLHPFWEQYLMNYPTDIQLKQVLAKMLPDRLECTATQVYWRMDVNPEMDNYVIKDTELLHLCWLVEEVLTEREVGNYTELMCDCTRLPKGKLISNMSFHATWQQRVTALAKVKGIEV